jgi:hypothetical protein
MTCIQAAISFAVALLATASTTDVANAQNVAGTYTLATIDGKALPGVIEVEGDCREEIVTATLVLGADGTWKLDRHERDVCGTTIEDETEADSGRYTVNGPSIEFFDDKGKSQRSDEGDDLEDLATGSIREDGISIRVGGSGKAVLFRKK